MSLVEFKKVIDSIKKEPANFDWEAAQWPVTFSDARQPTAAMVLYAFNRMEVKPFKAMIRGIGFKNGSALYTKASNRNKALVVIQDNMKMKPQMYCAECLSDWEVESTHALLPPTCHAQAKPSCKQKCLHKQPDHQPGTLDKKSVNTADPLGFGQLFDFDLPGEFAE